MLLNHYEKLLLAAALGAVAAGCVWHWRMQSGLRRVRSEPEQPALAGSAPAPTELPPAFEAHAWARPPAQSQGGGWLYEVFTPPVIYYNTAARSFAVTAPHYAAEATETVFGLELLAVKREPYRLQLAGYFGGSGDYLAAFVSAEVPQTLLARTGRRFEELGLTLRSFAVRKVAVETDGAAGPVHDIAALAVLFDEQANAEVVLDSRAPSLTDTPLAVFQRPDGKGRPREFHEGDTFSEADATYRIERIQLDPPEVVVARTVPGVPVPESRVLRPATTTAHGMAGKVRRSQPLVTRLQEGVASHD